MRYVYLHGFASGPQSRKAQAFRAAMAERGVELEIPDLAEGDFAHLTISAQLGCVERLLGGEPASLTGSSMGGYLAALYAAAHPEVERLVLLAPALAFSSRWEEMTGPERLGSWRDSGWLEVFHYGDKAERLVHYGLLEDSRRFPAMPDFQQPAAIFHGTQDDVVPVGLSRAFAAAHPHVALTELDSDHELLNALPAIVSAGVSFLCGPAEG